MNFLKKIKNMILYGITAIAVINIFIATGMDFDHTNFKIAVPVLSLSMAWLFLFSEANSEVE